MLKVGQEMFWGSFSKEACFSHSEKYVHPLKEGAHKYLPCLEGGGQKVSDL